MSHKRSEQLDFVVWSVSQLKSLKITIQIDVSMVNGTGNFRPWIFRPSAIDKDSAR